MDASFAADDFTPRGIPHLAVKPEDDEQQQQQMNDAPAADSGPRRVANMNRRRAARACDGCRRVKEKCEGGLPCRRCTHLHRQCEFSSPASRGRAGSSAVLMTADAAAAGGPSAVPAVPDPNVLEMRRRMNNMERLLTHFMGDVKLDPDTLQSLADSVERTRGGGGRLGGVNLDDEDGLESASQSSDHVNVDEVSFQPLGNNATHYSGEFSHWNFSMRIKNWIEQTGPHRTDAPDAPKIKEFYRFEELQSPPDAAGLSSSFPPRQIADFLTKAFFNHAQANYFYVDRTWLNRKMDVVFENPASLSRRDVPMLCILYMVLAVGTQYAYLDAPSNSNNSNSGAADAGTTYSEDNVGLMLYQQACKLLPDVITIASLESVQACLLIGLYTLPIDPSGLSWTYLNLASKLAIQNGMHRRYPGEGLDLVIRETRTRVWWTLYVLEKRIGTFHGRPVSIMDSEVDADWPVEKPDIWPGCPPSNTKHILATLHLCRTLGRMSHEISLFKLYDKRITFCALARLVDIKQELHAWWQDLPDEVCCRDPVPINGAVSREAAHVRLEYCVVRMYAGRLFIMPQRPSSKRSSNQQRQGQDPTRPGRPASSPAAATTGGGGGGMLSSSPDSAVAATTPLSAVTSQNAQRRALLIGDCIEAALCIVDTCRLLQNTVGLARASYTEFSALRVALLVLLSQFLPDAAASSGNAEDRRANVSRFRQPLFEGMAMLKGMSTWGASARFDVSLIEAFEHAIAKMDAENGGDGAGDARPAASPRESDYDLFKKWEMGQVGSSGNVGANTGTRPMAPGQQTPREDKAFDPSLGIPSLVGNAADAWDSALPRQSAMSMPPSGPGGGPGGPGPGTGGPGAAFGGIDGSFVSMPMLEGLSATLHHGYGFQMDMDGAAGAGRSGNWMGL